MYFSILNSNSKYHIIISSSGIVSIISILEPYFERENSVMKIFVIKCVKHLLLLKLFFFLWYKKITCKKCITCLQGRIFSTNLISFLITDVSFIFFFIIATSVGRQILRYLLIDIHNDSYIFRNGQNNIFGGYSARLDSRFSWVFRKSDRIHYK